jgi:cytochrome bd-type quinol oxidase subunit 2
MADSAVLTERPHASPATHTRARAVRLAIGIAVWTFLLGNAAGLVWMWWHGGNVTKVHTTGEALTSAARLTGLMGAYLALIQVVLLARLPFLERLAGFDRLTVWQAASSPEALKFILVGVCISVPAIAGYTIYSYRVFRGKTGELKYA